MGRGTKSAKPVTLHGIGVSPGVVIGPVHLVVSEALDIVVREVAPEAVHHEICRLEEALIETRRQIKSLQRNLEKRTPMSDASILDAHLMVLDDRTFIEEVVERIRGKRRNAEAAVKEVADNYASVLASVEDDYLRERVSDIRDVVRRVIRNLLGGADTGQKEVQHRHIIVAKDLAPSETAAMRKDLVIGFATDLGSPTSHSAVMARALEIPAVVGLHDVCERVATGDEVLIDGNKGILILHPSSEQLEEYGRVAEARDSIRRGLGALQHEPAETKDGRRIVLSANTEGLEELDAVEHYGAEGVGLFRSEYLFLTRGGMVEEDEQADVYRRVAERLAPAPVIIRTMDLGGDKYFDGSFHQREANPFLGCRSIRLSLLHTEPFRKQLRAILRASAGGNVKLMYPMISNVGEVIRANELLEQSKRELASGGVPFNPDIDVGVMIEIPGAALTADAIAAHVKFFSLGTNDLIQYTLAVDRVNERVAYLYEPTHPAVLKLIHASIEAGHRHGIWVGLCGEMAGDPMMTALLLGLGVDELSVAPSAVPLVKDAVRGVRYEDAKALAATALTCETGVEVLSHCRKVLREAAPELLELI